jgi:hypothetical protein
VASNDIRLNVSADVREAESELKRLEEEFDKLQKASGFSSGDSISGSSREIDDATRKFQDAYNSLVNSMQSSIDNLKGTIEEYDRQLEQSQRASDNKTSQSIQGQINALETQRQQLQETMRVADDMYRKQQDLFNNMHNTSGSGGSGGFGGGGNTGGTNTTDFGGGNRNLPVPYTPPPSQDNTNPNSPGGGSGGSGGLSIGDLFGGYMGISATRHIFGALNSGYDLMDRDERLAYNTVQKTGDYGSDYKQARKDIEQLARNTSHTMSESAQVASTYETIGGVTNTKNSLADVDAFQKFGRAYAVDANQLASVAGNMNKIGATNEGEQQKFAGMIAESIKQQNMSGRESELIESTNQLAQSVASAKTTVNNSDLTGIMAMQNMFGEMSPQLRGSQGANVLSSMNSNIQNADNGMQILLGRNSEFTGPEGMLSLRRQMEKGISDPQNLARILQNSEKLAGGNKSYQEMILMDKLGISSSVADQLLSDSNYDDLKSGKKAQSEIEKITSSNGDLDSKYDTYNNSGVRRRDAYRANKENSSKAVGDIEDSIVTPWQNTYNNSSVGGQIAMNALSGAAGIGMYSIGSKLLSGLFKGKFKNPFGGAGGAASEAAEAESFTTKGLGFMGDASVGAEAAGGFGDVLSKAGKIIGKGAPIVSGLFSAYDEYSSTKANGGSDGEAVAKGAGAGIGGGLGAWGGAEAGAAIGAFGGPIGAGIGGIIGGIAGAFGGSHIGSSVSGNLYNDVSKLEGSGSSSSSTGSVVSERIDQQKQWKDILQTESDVVKRREDLNKDSQKSANADGTSSFWNNSSSANNITQQFQPKKEKSLLDEIGDWFSNLFGGGSDSDSGTSTKSINGGMNGNSKLGSGGSGWSNVNQWDKMVQKSAKEYGVDPNLIKAVMMQESGGNKDSVSSAGAYGLMQITSDSAETSGMNWNQVKNDPQANINAGASELARDLKANNGDIKLALAAYNAGQGAVNTGKYLGYKETMDYIQKVPKYYEELQNSASKYAIGAKSLSNDGLIYAHKGEKVVPANENPDNPANVSTASLLGDISGGSNVTSRSSNISGSLNLTITVNGTGFSKEQQGNVANAAIQVINNNQPQLLNLLSNGMTREVN